MLIFDFDMMLGAGDLVHGIDTGFVFGKAVCRTGAQTPSAVNTEVLGQHFIGWNGRIG